MDLFVIFRQDQDFAAGVKDQLANCGAALITCNADLESFFETIEEKGDRFLTFFSADSIHLCRPLLFADVRHNVAYSERTKEQKQAVCWTVTLRTGHGDLLEKKEYDGRRARFHAATELCRTAYEIQELYP